MAAWKRYRFVTTTQEDMRPLVFNPAYPWWISGETGDGQWTVIIAYLPADEPLEKYWDDADEVEYTDEEAISFSSRFPKPAYFRAWDIYKHGGDDIPPLTMPPPNKVDPIK